MKKFLYLALCLPLYTQAENIPLPQPLFFENQTLPKTIEPRLKTQPKSTALSMPPMDFDAANAQNKLEQLINYGVRHQQWALLEQVLPLYQQQPHYDVTLYHYALGALAWEKKDYAQAIALYREILTDKPHLAYPRFDLGVMLFEDKQYRAAQAELTRARPALSPALQQLTQQYLAAIAQRQAWQPSLEAQYTQTDNVNNAASQREVWLGNWRLLKTEDSLPQKAHGVRYGLGVNREVNLVGHHFATASGRFDGVNYWDNADYNEKSLSLSAGYRFRAARYSWGLAPFFEQNWLGTPRYSQNFGIVADFRRELNARWTLSGSFSHSQKRYAEETISRRFNGYINGLALSLSYQVRSNWLLFGGVDASFDRARDKAESSLRRGLNLGTMVQMNEFVGRLGVRYVKRDFRAENFYFPDKKRQDHEYSTNVSLWHTRLQWHGFMPKLNYRYRKIASNIPEFYARKNDEWFISVEKNF